MVFLICSFTLTLLSALALSSNMEPNCEELIKPLVLDANYSSTKIMGKWILDEAVSQGLVTRMIEMMETHWMELSLDPNNDTVLVKQAYRIDNMCRFEPMEVPLKNNTLYDPVSNSHVRYCLLPSCPNCLTGYYTEEMRQFTNRVLLHFSRERQVSDSDRDLFRKQAECLMLRGITTYSDEPDLCQQDAAEDTAKQN